MIILLFDKNQKSLDRSIDRSILLKNYITIYIRKVLILCMENDPKSISRSCVSLGRTRLSTWDKVVGTALFVVS